MKILFVEDDPGFRKLSSHIAEKVGHECVTVDTVAGANQRLSETTFDLLALDLELPDGDGLEVVQRVLGELHADVPMVVITGVSRPQLAEGCEQLGLALIEKGPQFTTQFQRLLKRLEDNLAHAGR